jgi:hypothetical protein
MGFKSKAAVVVSGALTAGAFATLAAAMPAGAATFGTEQSEAGQVFAVAGSTIVGAGHTGQNTEFSQSVRGNTVVFRTGNNRCVADTFGGLGLQNCNSNSRWQRFDEVGGFGPFTALQNEGSHQYVQDNGPGRQVTTVSVRSWGRNHRQNFSRDQLWRWTEFNNGGWPGGGGGPNPGGPNRPVTASSLTRVTDEAAPGNGSPVSWARLDFTRLATVKLQGPASGFHCGGPAPCYAYTATLNDDGTLATIPGSLTPNQSFPYHGHTEANPSVNGSYHGTTDITFYATSNHPTGRPGIGNQNDGGHADNPTGWVLQFFSPGTHVAGATVADSDYEFATNHQHWSDRSSDHGQGPGDGNIDGH